ncbi:class I SAM-dependent methyltransferase [Candidatus Parcubacteria bacterium]|nr:class I SAM-dependent methyltransferase [Candidatus Parcubacteria bacterium]
MELRKQKEIEFYDKQAQKKQEAGDFEGFNPNLLNSYQFCCQWLKKNCRGKKLLDYGCGNGVHSIFPAQNGAQVKGIDLSEPSLEIAKKRAKQEQVEDKIEFLLMDCEKLNFPDNFFDIIFDGGAFSSLDLNKAFPELIRVLKPNGYLIGIETLGHNPIANLKRKFNKLSGKRTGWAESHIFKIKDLKTAERHFNGIEVYFFHIISFLAFPFLNLPGGKILLRLLEKIDKILFKFSFLRKYAFKIVFIFSNPKKYAQKII